MTLKNIVFLKELDKALFRDHSIQFIGLICLIALDSVLMTFFFRVLPAKAIFNSSKTTINSVVASDEALPKNLQQHSKLSTSVQDLTENISQASQQSHLPEKSQQRSELQTTPIKSNLQSSLLFSITENSQIESELEAASRKSNLLFSFDYNQTKNFRIASEAQITLNEFNPRSSLANITENRESNQSNSLLVLKSNPQDDDSLLSQTEQTQPKVQPEEDPNFISPPRIINNNQVNPLLTVLPLNGTQISHLTEFETTTGYEFGSNRSDNLLFNGIIKLDSQIQDNLTRNNVYRLEQRGDYLQLQTVTQFQETSITRVEPRTLIGLELQFSVNASCFLVGGNPNDQCTYTPALETDRNRIDPDTFLPTGFIINPPNSQLGQVVTPESLAAIKLPGFQRGANGQEIGLDLYLPNVGSTAGNTQSNTTKIARRQEIDNTPVAFFSGVRQIIKANDEEAVIGRTVRGLGFVLDDKNTLLNSALQLGTQVLPDLIPNLRGSANPADRNFNRNLFFAANNTRLPADSFLIYHAGIGRASNVKMPVRNINDVPSANFNSVWFGISPVTERTYSSQERLEATGTERLVASGGAEGGASNLDLDFTIINDNDIFSNGNLVDVYPQLYVSAFNRDVNLITTSRLTEKTSYYPHISFTGNITGATDIFRYYSGSIFSDNIKAYLGLDYAKTTLNGWRYNFGAIGYINPDRDYYSRVSGSTSKIIPLSSNSNLVLSTAFNYDLDRETRIGEQILISPSSFFRVGAAANIGSTSLELINFFGDILPNSIDNTLLFNLTIRPFNNLRLSAYFAPINENDSRTRYGASAQLRFGNGYNSPTLSFNYINYEYDFGADPFGLQLQTTEDVFTVLFRFGEPQQPFSPQTTPRLRDGIEGKPTAP